jgi:hypothetical protein
MPRSYPNAHPPYSGNPYGYGDWGNLLQKSVAKFSAAGPEPSFRKTETR